MVINCLKNQIKITTLILISFVVLSCETVEDNPIHYTVDDLSFISFSLEGGGKICKSFLMNDSTIFITVPQGSDLTSMKATFLYKGAKVVAKGEEQISGHTINDYSDFSNPIVFRIYTEEGEYKDFKILLFDLPVVIINTPGNVPIKNKTDWVGNSHIRIIDTDGSTMYDGETGIKGRGNISWLSYQKKCYSLKLPEKATLFDMKKSKRWVLLGHSGDYTKIRTPLSFKICELMGMEWSPTGKNVELILNDTLLCNYYICEQIRAEKNRVNIKEMTPADTLGEAITGGYLLEASVEFDEEFKFHSKYFDMPFMLKSPNDNVPNKQIAWIESFINKMEETLINDDDLKKGRYRDYLDEYSFIKWWLVSEITTNIEESQADKNFYMYKDRGYDTKLHASAPWDFDWGTYRAQVVEQWVCKNKKYFSRLFANEDFCKKTKEVWNLFYPNSIVFLNEYVEELRTKNRYSVMRDRFFFPKPTNDNPTNRDNHMSYDEGVNYIKEVLMKRMEWLNAQITSL